MAIVLKGTFVLIVSLEKVTVCLSYVCFLPIRAV